MRRQAAMACMALVLVAGCTGGDSDDSSAQTTTTVTTSSSFSSPSNTLCGTIPTELLDRLSGDYTPREDLVLGREHFVGCDVDGMSTFEFGIQVIDVGVPIEDHLTGEVEELDGIGEEAYRSPVVNGDELVGETIVARQGDRVVLVRNDLLPSGPERATEADTVDVANLLLDLPADQVAAIEKVVVGPPCPSIDQASTVLVDVELARAQDVPGTDDIDCSYYSSDGVRLLVSSFQQDDAAEFLGYADPVDIEGAASAEISDSGSGFEITALVGSDTIFHVSATGSARADDPGAVDRSALIALAEDVIANR